MKIGRLGLWIKVLHAQIVIKGIKGVEPAFIEKRRFLTGATDKRTLDFQIFFSAIDRYILDLETSPSKFVLLNKFLS